MWRWLSRLFGRKDDGGGPACEGERDRPRESVTMATMERASQRMRRDIVAASVAIGRALDSPGGVEALMGEWSGETDALPGPAAARRKPGD
jgi:hypothetical protein